MALAGLDAPPQLLGLPGLPDLAEVAANPRARSAKLRAAERTDAPAQAADPRALLPRLPTLANTVALTIVSPGVGPTATGDPVLIERALEVIVKNAIDALSGRGGRIEVKVDATDRGARVMISDDGPGVPAEMRSQLFEPGVSTKTAGWGIGLALARRIVEQQHGGRVSFRPGDGGQGSVFVLEFPRSAK